MAEQRGRQAETDQRHPDDAVPVGLIDEGGVALAIHIYILDIMYIYIYILCSCITQYTSYRENTLQYITTYSMLYAYIDTHDMSCCDCVAHSLYTTRKLCCLTFRPHLCSGICVCLDTVVQHKNRRRRGALAVLIAWGRGDARTALVRRRRGARWGEGGWR